MKTKVRKKYEISHSIKGYWYDDNKSEVESFCDKLNSSGIEIKLINADYDNLINMVSSSSFSIGLYDLKIDNGLHNGIDAAGTVRGVVEERDGIHPKMISVSNYKEMFINELERDDPFVCHFSKRDLHGEKYNQFINKIISSSCQFNINLKAKEFHNDNPLKFSDFEEEKVMFGYIEEIDDDHCLVNLWDPKLKNEGKLFRVPSDKLYSKDINEVGQAFRYIKYKHIETKDTLNVYDSISELNRDTLYPINGGMTYKTYEE